jgi:hypothetical protein
MTSVLWTGRSKNPTTGDIPQGYVGASWDQAKESCGGCKYLPEKDGGDGGCFHWQGSSWMAHSSMIKAHNRGKDYTLGHAISKSTRSAKFARLAVGGDPNILKREEVEAIREELSEKDMGCLGYTHFPEGKAAHLKGVLMASCDWDWEKADRVVDAGWRATISVPADVVNWSAEDRKKLKTPDGRKIKLCPHKMGATIKTKRGEFDLTCNDCGWCDAQHKGPDIVAFPEHGRAVKLMPQRKTSRMSKLGVAIGS